MVCIANPAILTSTQVEKDEVPLESPGGSHYPARRAKGPCESGGSLQQEAHKRPYGVARCCAAVNNRWPSATWQASGWNRTSERCSRKPLQGVHGWSHCCSRGLCGEVQGEQPHQTLVGQYPHNHKETVSEAYKQAVPSGNATDWQGYYKLHKQLHKEIAAKKIQQWQEFNDEINTDFRKDPAQFWQLAGRLCGKSTTKAGGVNVVRPDGTPAQNIEEAQQIWRDYFMTLGNADEEEADAEWAAEVTEHQKQWQCNQVPLDEQTH